MLMNEFMQQVGMSEELRVFLENHRLEMTKKPSMVEFEKLTNEVAMGLESLHLINR